MKLPAIDLQAALGKVPGLSKFIKPKADAKAGAAKAKASPAKSHDQQVQTRLDLTMKGLSALALLLVLFALYSVFSQNSLNKAIHSAAPPMVDLGDLAPAAEGKAAAGKGDQAKEAKAANNAKIRLPEGTDARIDYAFEQVANFENTRAEAILRSTRANVAGVVAGSVAARAGFRVGDLILSVDGEQAGFVWDTLRKLTGAGKTSALLEVQRGNEVLRGELEAPEGETLTSSNSGLLFDIPEGYRFVGDNDRRDLRSGFSRAYMEGLAGDERLAYATSLALLGGNLVKRGVEQTSIKPDDPMWLKTEQILADHHSKFSKALAQHDSLLDSMQAKLQAGFIKIGALLLAALIAGIAALAAALQLNKHLSEAGLGAVKAQLQGLRSQMDQLAHAAAASTSAVAPESQALSRSAARQTGLGARGSDGAQTDGPAASSFSKAAAVGAATLAGAIAGAGAGSGGDAGYREGAGASVAASGASGMSLAELAARVALASDADEEKSQTSEQDEAESDHDVLVDHAPGSTADHAPVASAIGDSAADQAADAASLNVNRAVTAPSDDQTAASGEQAPMAIAEQASAANEEQTTAASSGATDAAGAGQSLTAAEGEIANAAAVGVDAPASVEPVASAATDGQALTGNASRTGDGASA